uniref:Laminin IV type A domain-containing protein n=1 Tax=Anopheles christyi TaxID=43041 RepID=A0A182JVI8_9DIPT
MWNRSMKFLAVVLFVFLSFSTVYGYDSEDVSLEYETTPTFDVVIAEGKKLKLKVHDYGRRPLCNPVWNFNGNPVSKSRCIPSYGELVCPSVKREDAGRYDLWGGDGNRHNQARLIFSANVQVTKHVERDEPVMRIAHVQDISPPFERINREWNDCFCSGVTGRCRMAHELYRMRKTFNLSNMTFIRTLLLADEESATTYLRIPLSDLLGNLITAYGGNMRFPVTEECYTDRSKPCLLMFDKRNMHRAVAYFLPASHDQRQVQVEMKESSWKLLSAIDERGDREPEEALTKFIFMSTLSNIHEVYIRGRYRTRNEDNILSIDMASSYDEGLGPVTTVEECDCHPGYGGLSCERCEKGYLRSFETISSEGICLSIPELWKLHKKVYRQN